MKEVKIIWANLENAYIGAHRSPLQLEIADDGDNNLIKVLLTNGAHWSPLELEIEDFKTDQG